MAAPYKAEGTDDEARMALREITAILESHDLGGVMMIMSRDRAFYQFSFPTWVAIKQVGTAIRIRIKKAELPKGFDVQALSERTAGFIMSMKDLSAQQFAMAEQIEAMLRKHWDIDHKSFEDHKNEADN